ncbi:cyanophycinase [Kordiimonas gwangyangensis]|uniref:cyanophycinase n=1 Tax=Kordiimonas gwangyangensis TaxID=288022 RepID=UPI0003624501|nr:cyanophycinase [Kordiimonas gwangyangensis]
MLKLSSLIAGLMIFASGSGLSAVQADTGTLLIIGGALDAENVEVHEAFLKGSGASGTIAIIPAASGSPAGSAAYMVERLAAFGANPARISTVRLATEDDTSTPDADESTWCGNAYDDREIAKLEAASAVWFTGGDQARIVACLIAEDGSDTPMLAAVRGVLQRGGIVAGTSAGAAIMSRTMMLGGESIEALTGTAPSDPSDAFKLGIGLGFLACGVVDQHFGQRARLGRLAMALAAQEQPDRLGFGIDENTALLVDPAQDTATVLGAGAVTVLDGRQASFGAAPVFAATNFVLSMAVGGDRIALATGAISLAPGRKPTVGGEYYSHAPQEGGGLALPAASLDRLLGRDLLDNSSSASVRALSFLNSGRGVRYRFTQTAQSAAFWSEASPDHYTLTGVRFDIEPVRVVIQSIPKNEASQ